MSVFIGALLLIGGIVLIFLGRNSQNQILAWFDVTKSLLVSLVGIILISLNGMFFYAEAGYGYLVQYPTGTQIAELKPGYHLKWWGEVVPWKKVLTIKFRSHTEKHLDDQDYSGVRNLIPVRFNDAVKADIALSARFKLPEVANDFLAMALDFRSQSNLINSSLIPSCMEVAKNSARLISAQEYIAGRGGELESAVLDQLENGIYTLDAKAIKPLKKDSLATDSRSFVRFEVNKRKNKDGSVMRKKHSIKQYNIIVAQATVEDVDPEKRFKELLGKQRDAAAQASIEKEKAKQAQHEKQRIIAEGEAQKAKIRVNMEKEQITTMITAETAQKKEEITVKKRKLELASAKLKAQEIKVLADAEAYKKQKVMQADGALEMKLKTYEKVHEHYARAITGMQLVPTTYIGSNTGKGTPSSMDFINLATANMAKQLNLNMKPTK